MKEAEPEIIVRAIWLCIFPRPPRRLQGNKYLEGVTERCVAHSSSRPILALDRTCGCGSVSEGCPGEQTASRRKVLVGQEQSGCLWWGKAYAQHCKIQLINFVFLLLYCSLANVVPKINPPETVSPAVATYASSMTGEYSSQKKKKHPAPPTNKPGWVLCVESFFALLNFWLIFHSSLAS